MLIRFEEYPINKAPPWVSAGDRTDDYSSPSPSADCVTQGDDGPQSIADVVHVSLAFILASITGTGIGVSLLYLATPAKVG